MVCSSEKAFCRNFREKNPINLSAGFSRERSALWKEYLQNSLKESHSDLPQKPLGEYLFETLNESLHAYVMAFSKIALTKKKTLNLRGFLEIL